MGKRREPRKQIQVPVRIFGTDSSGNVFSESVVTVNVGQQGVEVSGVRSEVKSDEILGLTYGTNRARFKVRWIGTPGTPKAGHLGLQNIAPEKPLWDFELPSAGPDNFQAPVVQQRSHSRIECRNSVELHTPEGDSFWATIADLSVAGCYVEMAIPLHRGTKVNLGIWIGENKVWADGEVAYSTPGLGIGVKFNKVSLSDLDRIQQYLAPLAKFARKPSF